ncbi:MAG: hypothetical protein EOL97_13515 [Spirochaetia bacterium]|nr:hypothetical protein [Spirochaetia bacterium]
MGNYSATHSHYLDNLLKNFNLINENILEMEWIMKEGILLANHSKNHRKLNDIIGGYYNGIGLNLELKGNVSKRSKAVEQLKNGYELLDKFGYKDIRSKVVYYDLGKYSFEEINKDELTPQSIYK